MARMKFLCDADRCIECNACVTACKNENEVPWGINRRRVVTINDGKPGERSVSMACMHCTDAPCAAVCPVNCFYTTADARGAAFQGPLHRLRLLLLRLPVRRAAISAGRQFRLARQDGQVHLSAPAARSRTTSAIQYEKYGANRLSQGKLPLCAEMCSTKSLACRRRRHHRANLQRPRGQTRLRLRRLGMADRLSRNHRDLTPDRKTATARRRPRREDKREKANGDGLRAYPARRCRDCIPHPRCRRGARCGAAARFGRSQRRRRQGAAIALTSSPVSRASARSPIPSPT